MSLSEEEQEELVSAGWDLIRDVIFEGRLRLRRGQVREAGVREILDTAKFLASQRRLRVRKVPNLDKLLERTDAKEG